MPHPDLTPEAVAEALAIIAEPRNAIERSVRRCVESRRGIATSERAHEINAAEIAPTRVADFVRLAPDERLALIAIRADERIRASRRGRTTRRREIEQQTRRERSTAKVVDGFLRGSKPRATGATAAPAVPREAAAPEQHSMSGCEPSTETRFVVGCACSCGALVPARGPRPVVRYAAPLHRPKPRRVRRPVAD